MTESVFNILTHHFTMEIKVSKVGRAFDRMIKKNNLDDFLRYFPSYPTSSEKRILFLEKIYIN